MKKQKQSEPRKRWWNDRRLVDAGTPAFQSYQFETGSGGKSLGRPRAGLGMSSDGVRVVYGDHTLQRHVEKLLDGIHEFLTL